MRASCVQVVTTQSNREVHLRMTQDQDNPPPANSAAPAGGADDRAWLIETTQRLHNLQRAVRAGELRVHESLVPLVEEVMAISLVPGELLDPSRVSSKAIGLVRTGAMALRFTAQERPPDRLAPIGRPEGQAELFRHFAQIFAAFTGHSYDAFPSEVELASAARQRAQHESPAMIRAFEEACAGLGKFYRDHGSELWAHARELGGLKLVLGGQRTFGPSAFRGVRKMALYVDTQLIADPVFPFFERQLDLKAGYVELLRQLYHLLQLTPLVQATLPVPPVFVFPSFEKVLEDGDVQTQIGIHDLVAQTLGAACGVVLTTMDEVTQFVRAEPDRFIDGVMREQLFLPPGVAPGEIVSAGAAVERYIAEVSQYRTAESVRQLGKLPVQAVLLTGIAERLAPQYHLLENATELSAQPMLTQVAHWHFFQKASNASALSLHRKNILSADALKVLQALQHQRLAWLANVPVPLLAELLANQENLAFRKELAEHTKTLSAAGQEDLDRVVREVCHAIDAMVQSHQKTIGEIERKYGDKYQTTLLAGGFGALLGGAAMFLPALSVLGAAAPLTVGAGMVGKLAIDRFSQGQEARRARASLLGVLATTPRD